MQFAKLDRDNNGYISVAEYDLEYPASWQQILKSTLYCDFKYNVYQGTDFWELLPAGTNSLQYST